MIRLLFVGDVVGKPGRKALECHLPSLLESRKVDLCIVNAENAAGGKGLTRKVAEELFARGADILSTGNHVWDERDIFELIENDDRVIRPANFPPGVPGRGWTRVKTAVGIEVAVIQIQGRVFMDMIDCPFRAMDSVLKQPGMATVKIVDFHADATSEKVAMGWYLDGRVSALIGTHTHVPTADERILPKGTAYITDVGMTGPFDSVIGVQISPIIDRFIYRLPTRNTVARDNVKICAVQVDIDEETGQALSIERILQSVDV
jgi:metallophosphoesterase (TIGR00282 family)